MPSRGCVVPGQERDATEGLGRVGGSAEAGPATDRRRGRGGASDAGAAAGAAGGDALVDAGCWPSTWGSRSRRWRRIWREWGLQPWRRETFKFSTDPELEAKVRDVVGLYLDPPEKAVVLCVDEKSQIQALDRTAPILPMRPGPAGEGHPRLRPPRHHHPVRRPGGRHRQGHRRLLRRGTATTSSCASSSRSPRPTRGVKLHVVVRQLRHPQAPRPSRPGWPSNPRITLHFTPTSGSWLNLVEIFFGIITRQAIRRGTFTSVKDLIAAIETLHRRLERPLPPVHLDQDRRRDPRPRPPAVKDLHSRDTSLSSKSCSTANITVLISAARLSCLVDLGAPIDRDRTPGLTCQALPCGTLSSGALDGRRLW